MITHIVIDSPPPGSLNLYETDNGYGGHSYFTLEVSPRSAQWEERLIRRDCHIMVAENVDTTLENFDAGLPQWLGDLSQLGDGTLFLVVRHYVTAELPIAICGMAFVPTPTVEVYNDLGDPLLEGEDPVQLVRDAVRGVVPERMRANLVYRTRYNERMVAYQRAREEASNRALRLLNGFLTASQNWELQEKGHFHVRGQDGETYRIDARTHQNVYLMKGERRAVRYCAVMQDGGIPMYDMLLAQKLLIETDISRFKEIANAKDLSVDVHRIYPVGEAPRFHVASGPPLRPSAFLDALLGTA
jgi:hypothetical protein